MVSGRVLASLLISAESGYLNTSVISGKSLLVPSVCFPRAWNLSRLMRMLSNCLEWLVNEGFCCKRFKIRGAGQEAKWTWNGEPKVPRKSAKLWRVGFHGQVMVTFKTVACISKLQNTLGTEWSPSQCVQSSSQFESVYMQSELVFFDRRKSFCESGAYETGITIARAFYFGWLNFN